VILLSSIVFNLLREESVGSFFKTKIDVKISQQIEWRMP
jgi:hypothetical protein